MFDGDFDELLYPELTLETDDMVMDLTIKKDYSDIEDIHERKKEFIGDLILFIKECNETPESLEFFKYYDD